MRIEPLNIRSTTLVIYVNQDDYTAMLYAFRTKTPIFIWGIGDCTLKSFALHSAERDGSRCIEISF